MNINKLEAEINFILANLAYINPYRHYPIEQYNDDYLNIFEFWQENKSNINFNQQTLKTKITTLTTLKQPEDNFIKVTDQLAAKFNQHKINNKLNQILTIMTCGLFNWNKKIKQKIVILKKIKEIKQQNLVKITELITRMEQQMMSKTSNTKQSFSILKNETNCQQQPTNSMAIKKVTTC